jgi:hypothetical protein
MMPITNFNFSVGHSWLGQVNYVFVWMKKRNFRQSNKKLLKLSNKKAIIYKNVL